MHLEGLRQAPFNCTLMGALRGVLDYHCIKASDAALYGLSGHAFLMNIHEVLCPSGPCCWNREPFFRLARNLGIETTDLGFFSSTSAPEERGAVEERLRAALSRGVPCSLLNLESQLITGTDDSGFLTAQPWAPQHDFPPRHLSFGTWEELGQECHVNFFVFSSVPAAELPKAVLDALEYAVDLQANPKRHTDRPYGVGPDAYANWIGAVAAGHGSSHGNWWNATVWAECRRMAGEFLGEVALALPDTAGVAEALASGYAEIGGLLGQVSNKEMPAAEKTERLERARALEVGCTAGVARLAAALRGH